MKGTQITKVPPSVSIFESLPSPATGSQSAPESPSPRSGRRRHPGKEGCGRPHKPQARSDPAGDLYSHRAIPSAPEEGEAHPCPGCVPILSGWPLCRTTASSCPTILGHTPCLRSLEGMSLGIFATRSIIAFPPDPESRGAPAPKPHLFGLNIFVPFPNSLDPFVAPNFYWSG
jgi:hypothetical protein